MNIDRSRLNAGIETAHHVLVTKPPLDLLAYYKCEEPTGATVAADSHNGKDLSGPETALLSGAGKIGSAFNSSRPTGATLLSAVDAAFWGGKSFTLRLWAKLTRNDYHLWPGAMVSVEERLAFSVRGSLRPQLFLWGYPLYPNYQMFYAQQAVTLDAWHRLICWYDDDVQEVGFKIDNDESYWIAAQWSMATKRGTQFHIDLFGTQEVPESGNDYIDEVAIWNGVLSEQQMEYDWNDGAGRSYPDLPIHED